MKILFSVDTVISRRDVNGNCYNYSQITHNETGNTLYIDGHWGSDGRNLESTVRSFGVDQAQYTSSEKVLPIRLFNRLLKSLDAISENAFTKKHLDALRKKRVTV